MASSNGLDPDLGSFAVWRSFKGEWRSPQRLKTEYRRRFGKESVLRAAGARLYLVTPEEGALILRETGRSIPEIKTDLSREVNDLSHLRNMSISDFDISDPDPDGVKTLSLTLEEGEESQGQHQEGRDRILEVVGAEGLELPDLALSVDIGTIAGRGTRRDFKPVMNAYMPQGRQFSMGAPLLMHRPPQSSPNL